LTENRLNALRRQRYFRFTTTTRSANLNIAKCEHIKKYQNGAMAHLKTAYSPLVGHVPPVGNHCFENKGQYIFKC